jgi:hypothetical protein
MRIVLAALLGFFSTVGLASAEPAGQPLSIVLTADGADARRLDRYTPGDPIDIAVTTRSGSPFSAVTLVAGGPAGAQSYPLRRMADGSFAGRIVLSDAGTWDLHLVTAAGRLQTATAPFELNVAAAPEDGAWAVAIGVGAGSFFILGGLGWLIVGRTARARRLPAAGTRRAA